MPGPLKESQVTLRLPNELKSRVQAYAELAGRSKSHVVMEAVREYLAWRMPQAADLTAAIAAADAGDWANGDEVRAVFERYAAPPGEPAARTKLPAKTTARPRPGAGKAAAVRRRP
jgi:RHH-type transcriptional regulator, rel operon repressor / antitoxin RelB